MKVKVLTGALLMACWGVAHADVTLYGLLDVGPTYVSNEGGGKVFALTDGVEQESRFGFKGSEDLGGGYSANFNLESGFDITNGKAELGLAFARKAQISLSGPFGTVSMGRDEPSLADVMGRYTAGWLVYGPSYLSVHPGNYDGVWGIPVSNEIKYASPVIAGLSFHGMVAPGGVAGSFVRNSTFSAGMNYENGSLSLGAAWMRSYGENITEQAELDPSADPFGPTGPDDRLDTYAIGASYNFNGITVHTLATQSKFAQSDVTARTYEVGVRGTFEYLVLGLDGSRTIVRDKAGMSLAAASADYFLSKRTDLYFVTAYEHVGGTNTAGGPLSAEMYLFSASSTSSQLAVHVGIRHRF